MNMEKGCDTLRGLTLVVWVRRYRSCLAQPPANGWEPFGFNAVLAIRNGKIRGSRWVMLRTSQPHSFDKPVATRPEVCPVPGGVEIVEVAEADWRVRPERQAMSPGLLLQRHGWGTSGAGELLAPPPGRIFGGDVIRWLRSFLASPPANFFQPSGLGQS
jgi:hypothetical protein